jgi:hypothetical protein
MLTKEQYTQTKARIEALEKWRNGRTSYHTSEVPAHLATITNDDRSASEVYEFVTNPPERYFLYINHPEVRSTFLSEQADSVRYGSSGLATTWTGEKLGDVQFGTTFRSSFGDTRVSIRVYAVNGRTYAGTYYKSAGDYARVKLVKN